MVPSILRVPEVLFSCFPLDDATTEDTNKILAKQDHGWDKRLYNNKASPHL